VVLFFSDTAAFTVSPREAVSGLPSAPPARAPSAAVLKRLFALAFPFLFSLAIAANRLDSSNRICRRTGMGNAMTR
jgi:hypothetical protein